MKINNSLKIKRLIAVLTVFVSLLGLFYLPFVNATLEYGNIGSWDITTGSGGAEADNSLYGYKFTVPNGTWILRTVKAYVGSYNNNQSVLMKVLLVDESGTSKSILATTANVLVNTLSTDQHEFTFTFPNDIFLSGTYTCDLLILADHDYKILKPSDYTTSTSWNASNLAFSHVNGQGIIDVYNNFENPISPVSLSYQGSLQTSVKATIWAELTKVSDNNYYNYTVPTPLPTDFGNVDDSGVHTPLTPILDGGLFAVGNFTFLAGIFLTMLFTILLSVVSKSTDGIILGLIVSFILCPLLGLFPSYLLIIAVLLGIVMVLKNRGSIGFGE